MSVYKLFIFFKDEEQSAEYEYYDTLEEAEKRKEEYLQNKDKWFKSEEIKAIYISTEN